MDYGVLHAEDDLPKSLHSDQLVVENFKLSWRRVPVGLSSVRNQVVKPGGAGNNLAILLVDV